MTESQFPLQTLPAFSHILLEEEVTCSTKFDPKQDPSLANVFPPVLWQLSIRQNTTSVLHKSDYIMHVFFFNVGKLLIIFDLEPFLNPCNRRQMHSCHNQMIFSSKIKKTTLRNNFVCDYQFKASKHGK